jgi:Ser/Thr protein kinase RdoA (MazF antagonist)
MHELIGRSLGAAAELVSCQPFYIRYKPETNCLVQYRLLLDGSSPGGQRETLAHIKLFANDGAAKLWSSGSLQELAEGAGSSLESALTRAAYLPSIGAVLQLYPVDVAIPALAFAASDSGRRRVLQRVTGSEESPGVAPPGTIELIRYKAARRALLRYGTEGGPLYAKLYVNEGGGFVFSAGKALEAAAVPAAPPLVYLPDLRMLIQREIPGRPLGELGGSAGFDQAVGATGEALAQLHNARIPGLHRHTWAEEAADLLSAAAAVGAVRPDLSSEASSLAARVIERLGSLAPRMATIHGDFSDDQVIVGSQGAVLVDLDTVAEGHPLVDVGRFLAQLSLHHPDEDSARDAFLEGYGLPVGAEVGLLEAGMLLKAAIRPFRRLRSDWPAVVEHRLRLALRRLEDSTGHRSSARTGIRDPALPQLAVLTNSALIAEALTSHLEEPVEVPCATIVRHKPGRRCTLRYDLVVGGRPERLYGKTYASKRGSRVHRAAQAISEAHACGPAVGLPAPVAHLPKLKLLLQRAVEGAPVRGALLGGDTALAARIAEALCALHVSGVELDRRHGLGDELAALRARVEATALLQTRATLALVEAAAGEPVNWRWRPVHRDFYDGQVLMNGDRLAILDFDDAAMSEPAVDVANFLAHLRLLRLEQPAHVDPVQAVSAAFLKRCRELDPDLDLGVLCLLESATLLRLACIHERYSEPLVEASEMSLR